MIDNKAAQEIERLRQELYTHTSLHGIRTPQAQKISRRLDKLIYEYMRNCS